MVQFKPGRSWAYILKQTAKTTLAGLGILGVGSLALEAYVTVPPGQLGVVLKHNGDGIEITEDKLEPGSHWVNPILTRVLTVDTLPWTEDATAYIQCKGGELIKVEVRATMRVQLEEVRRFVFLTRGNTSQLASPIATLSGSALWGDAPAEDILAAYEQTPDAVQEQLLTAFRVAATSTAVDVSELRIKSMRVLTPAERKQRLLQYPIIEIANDLVRAVRLAVDDGVPPQEALAQLHAGDATSAEQRS